MKASGILLQDLHRTGANRDSSLGGHKQNKIKPRLRKGAMTHRRLNQNYLLVLEGLRRSTPQGLGHWKLQSWKVPLGIKPLGGHH